MAQHSHRPWHQAGRDIRLMLVGAVLLVVGTPIIPGSPVPAIVGPIPAIVGGIILLAFALSWMAKIIIAGEFEAIFWLMLLTVGIMALPLDPLARRIVGCVLMTLGIGWFARRVLRSKAEQARS